VLAGKRAEKVAADCLRQGLAEDAGVVKLIEYRLDGERVGGGIALGED
jgi:hypothetical protein